MAQVAAYEKTIADLRQTVETQKNEYDATIARQTVQIAALTSRVDTVTRDNVRLAGEKVALIDTVAQLTTEKNIAYYVIGTKDELVRDGLLVEEGISDSSLSADGRYRPLAISTPRSSPRSIVSATG